LPARIEYKASVCHDLKGLDPAVAEQILDEQESILLKNPGQGKLLEGQSGGRLKYHAGEYRFIYTQVEDAVLVLRVGIRTPKEE